MRLSAIASIFVLASQVWAADAQTVCDAMREVKGFRAERCEAIRLPDPAGGTMEIVSRLYRAEEGSLNLSLVTGSRAKGMGETIARTKELHTKNSVTEKVAIDGCEGLLTYNKRLQSGNVTLIIAPDAALVAAFNGLAPQNALAFLRRQGCRPFQTLFNADAPKPRSDG